MKSRASALLGVFGALLAGVSLSNAEPNSVAIPTEAIRPPWQVGPPPRVSKPDLGLAEAVQLTLQHNPNIKRARQSIALTLGQLESARGAFDPIFSLEPSYTHDQHENFPFVLEQERKKRVVLENLATVYTDLGRRLADELAQGNFGPPRCPVGIELDELDDIDDAEAAGQGDLLLDDFIISIDGLDLQDDFFELCTPDTETGIGLSILETINREAGLGLDQLFVTAEELQRDSKALLQNIAELIGARTALARERIGEIPKDEETKTAAIELSLMKPFRSGIQLGGGARFQSMERNFKHKSLDPAFGGMGIRNEYPSFVAAAIDIPLGRDGGRKVVTAPERAADRSLEAQREVLRHGLSSEVFATIMAYLDLRAAQESLALLEESADRQRRLIELTQQLIDTGDLARNDMARTQARAAAVFGAVAEARRAVVTGRFVLADAIGLRVEDSDDAPLAADALAERFPPVDPMESLLAQAVLQRRDYKALEFLRQSSSIRTVAAKANLARQLDLSFTSGMSTLYESPFFKHLPDELEVLPEDDPVHYGRVEGYWRSVQETWKPFVTVGLKFNFPFKNNAAKGRFAQERAQLRRSEIEVTDIERVIRDNVVRTSVALERAREVVERRRAAIGFYESTLQSTLQRYEDGDIGLIDTLTTEEELTQEKLRLVRAVQLHQTLLARLKFETGDLLQFDGHGTAQEMARFDPAAFLGTSSE